ncbi:MAG: hypothetical protein D6771_09400, partial [Zetaproteobacteria bacterium]
MAEDHAVSVDAARFAGEQHPEAALCFLVFLRLRGAGQARPSSPLFPRWCISQTRGREFFTIAQAFTLA